MATVDNQILSVSHNISKNIDQLRDDRSLLAQNILAQLRNLVEAVAVRLHLESGAEEFHYNQTGPAIDWIGQQNKQINFLHRFHKLLQMATSHYTLEGDASERLMLKYYELLLRIRQLLREKCGMDVLGNLEKFPVELGPSLRAYYEKIVVQIESNRRLSTVNQVRRRYYIHKVRPFFVSQKIFYEVTFSNANDSVNKFDRVIAFTDIDMTDKYAANLILSTDSITILGKNMPITLIRDWEISIRPCEFENFARFFDISTRVGSSSIEYRMLMSFLTERSANLLDLMDMDELRYARIKELVTNGVKVPIIFPILDKARRIIRNKLRGVNVLRYLMLRMSNRLIKLQFDQEKNQYMSQLKITKSSGPFESMPFCTSMSRHNPRIGDLLESLDPSDRSHEFLARYVKTNVEQNGNLYTPVKELDDFSPLEQLISDYNRKLPRTHTGRILEKDMSHLYIRDYEDGAVEIIQKIQEYVDSGVAGYGDAVDRWLGETPLHIDDEAKKLAMKQLFTKSRVALIYGAAGTGKSTMVNYIANYLGGNRKLFLAHTNPAKDNLERKVSAQNSEFRTISSQIFRRDVQPDYDVLIIDECSTVSNSDFLKVLQRTSFKLLVLVGDIYQIQSIQFGNWFSTIRSFVPEESVFELATPYRTNSQGLLEFWEKVRNREDGIEEILAQNGYSSVLGQDLFLAKRNDEIILCLNYDGLYGINNVNRFLQSSNPGKSVVWGVSTYKVGDPVLFNEVERFKPVIFNNLKGRIVDIVVHSDRVQFDVWIDRSVTALDVDGINLRYVGDSTVSFDVYPQGDTDKDDDGAQNSVPFQVAYAVSIHKAQGLEYESVKVVITDANEDDISHSIFYTAVTRAREHLQIFWTPETQKAVLGSLERTINHKDVAILKARRDVTPIS